MAKTDRLALRPEEIEQIKDGVATYRALARHGVPFDADAAREAAELDKKWSQVKPILSPEDQELPKQG